MQGIDDCPKQTSNYELVAHLKAYLALFLFKEESRNGYDQLRAKLQFDQGDAISEIVPHVPQSLRDAATPAFEVATLAEPFAEVAAFVEANFAAVLNFAMQAFVAAPAFAAQATAPFDSTYWLTGSMIKSSKNVKKIKRYLDPSMLCLLSSCFFLTL